MTDVPYRLFSFQIPAPPWEPTRFPTLAVFCDLSYAESIIRRHHPNADLPGDLRAEICFTPAMLHYVADVDPELLRLTNLADIPISFPERLPSHQRTDQRPWGDDWQIDVYLANYELNPVCSLYRKDRDLIPSLD